MRFIPQRITKIFTRKKRSLIPGRTAFLLLLIYVFLGTNAFSAEKDFFSYKRFFINENAVSGDRSQGLVQRELEAFVKRFNEGLYYFSSNNYAEAEKSLQDARQLWPEYYATDFLLAEVYEELGDYRTAARYYKSYLNKLEKLRNGSYRLTGPLMVSMNSEGIEGYEDAYSLVKNRIGEYGIDLDKVVPAFQPFEKFFMLFLIILTGAMVYFLYRKIRPYWRKRLRIMNPPEGFWSCRKCGTYNPDLRNECEECGRAKPVK